jgi:hypothetical protein
VSDGYGVGAIISDKGNSKLQKDVKSDREKNVSKKKKKKRGERDARKERRGPDSAEKSICFFYLQLRQSARDSYKHHPHRKNRLRKEINITPTNK